MDTNFHPNFYLLTFFELIFGTETWIREFFAFTCAFPEEIKKIKLPNILYVLTFGHLENVMAPENVLQFLISLSLNVPKLVLY